MLIDIILVLEQSGQHLAECIDSIHQNATNAKQLNLITIENRPNNAAAPIEHLDWFGGFSLLRCARGCSHLSAIKLAALKGEAPWILLLSPYCTLTPGFFQKLESAMAAHPDAAGFECRQLPWGSQHHIDPISLEIPFATGDAVVYSRRVFQQYGGFDERLPLPGSEIDLGRRMRAGGHKLYYLPHACTCLPAAAPPPQPNCSSYCGDEYTKLLFSYRYGRVGDIVRANKAYISTLRHPQHFEGVRKVLLKGYIRHLGHLWGMLASRTKAAQSNEWDTAFQRGLCPLAAPQTSGPKISVVVRTHARPAQLAGALQSLTHQTYPHFEVIVIEDGPPAARAVIDAFAHLPLRYHATGKPVGRGRAGNLGLEMATGEYLNFLDDDDFFYPDHLELMAAAASTHPDADLILGCSAAAFTHEGQHAAAQLAFERLSLIRFDRLNPFTMSQMCQIPLQSGMFKKSLFEQYGGLREDMDGHEDWAMWLRFLGKGKRINTSGIDIPRATSIFVQPADTALAKARMQAYMAFDAQLFGDDTLRFNLSVAELRRFYDDMLRDIRHVQTLGTLDAFLQQEENRDKERQ